MYVRVTISVHRNQRQSIVRTGATKRTDDERTTARNAASNTGTWPPKMKRTDGFRAEEPERPKTANLARPSVLDPALVDKLDMSLLSKELLCDSMTRFHQSTLNKSSSGDTTTSASSSSLSSLLLMPSSPSATRRRRRRSAAVPATSTASWSSREDAPVTHRQRQSFEQIREPRIATMTDRQMEETDRSRSPTRGQKIITSPAGPATRNPDVRKFDDNNNRSVI